MRTSNIASFVNSQLEHQAQTYKLPVQKNHRCRVGRMWLCLFLNEAPMNFDSCRPRRRCSTSINPSSCMLYVSSFHVAKRPCSPHLSSVPCGSLPALLALKNLKYSIFLEPQINSRRHHFLCPHISCHCPLLGAADRNHTDKHTQTYRNRAGETSE